jgi:hypothetical protein
MVTSNHWIRETWKEFRTLCSRIGENPSRVAAQALIRWMVAAEDALLLEGQKGEYRIRRWYHEEVKMPRPARRKKPAAPAANEAAKEAATMPPPAADPLAGLTVPAADPLAALPNISPVDGLDGLAEGVSQEAIEAAIASVTGGGSSSAMDAVASKAILDLKSTVEKMTEAITVLDNRIVALNELVQKGQTMIAQKVEGLGTEGRQGVMGLQATIRQILDFLESNTPQPAAPVAPSPAPSGNVKQIVKNFLESGTPQPAAPVAPSPAPSGNVEQIVKIVYAALAEKGNPTYPDNPAVWQAFSVVCERAGVKCTGDEVKAAFAASGRIKNGSISY